MSKLVTYNVPVKATRRSRKITIEQRQGYPIKLPLGGKMVRFMLQVSDDGVPRDLVHWASGLKVGNLNSEKVMHMVTYGHAARMSDRSAAKYIWARAIAVNGEAAVQAKLDATTTINA